MKNLIAIMALCLAGGMAEAGEIAGYDRLTVEAKHRAAPMEGSIWYPLGTKTYRNVIGDNAVFVGTPAYVGAGVAEGRHPLVVLSHGSGGNMDSLSWFSSALANKGAIVLAVNHPGSTSGDSSPRRSIRFWERAADASAALDTLLADPQLSRFVDTDRIYASGFSMGGLTALQLAGVRVSKAQYVEYCERMGERAPDCIFFAKGGVDLTALPEEAFQRSLRDERISGGMVIDPGLSWAFTQESVAGTDLPLQIFNLGGPEDRWLAVDMGPRGNDVAAQFPQADYVEVAPANHFTFLAICKPAGAAILRDEEDDPVCDDPQDADREAVHDQIIASMAEFLDL